MTRGDKQQSKLKKWVRLPKILCNCTGKNESSNVICPAPHTPKGLELGVGGTRKGGSRDGGNVAAEEEEGGGVGEKRVVLKRSYCVGVGKIGRIDEDKPCEFMEDVQTCSYVVSSVCPRTRYYAAAMRALS